MKVFLLLAFPIEAFSVPIMEPSTRSTADETTREAGNRPTAVKDLQFRSSYEGPETVRRRSFDLDCGQSPCQIRLKGC